MHHSGSWKRRPSAQLFLWRGNLSSAQGGWVERGRQSCYEAARWASSLTGWLGVLRSWCHNGIIAPRDKSRKGGLRSSLKPDACVEDNGSRHFFPFLSCIGPHLLPITLITGGQWVSNQSPRVNDVWRSSLYVNRIRPGDDNQRWLKYSHTLVK